MKKKIVWGTFILTGTILCGLLYPFMQIVVRFSYFDLAMGAFSGGYWSLYRIVLFTIFVTSALLFLISGLWLIQNKVGQWGQALQICRCAKDHFG
jgi:heme/copper-type cytochrome/quinol oxidase subunit 4